MVFCECLVRTLSEITNPTVAQVERVLRETDCTLKQVTPYITPPVAPLNYGRNVIYQSELFEIIVLNLPAHTETPIHDHGESFCCAKVVSGGLVNRTYHLLPPDNSISTVTEEVKHYTEDFFTVTKDQIHSMYNPSHEALITFHIYSPPIRNNQYYPA
jgi:cysteine dioxygenase